MPSRSLTSSSSVPTLPAAGGAIGRRSSSKGQLVEPGEAITLLENENEKLREALQQEKAKFSSAFIKDIKAPARRRLEPMRKLIHEQSETTSQLVTSATVKQQRLDAVMAQVVTDNSVEMRRMRDVMHLQEKLEYLEDQLAEADADAAEACDRTPACCPLSLLHTHSLVCACWTPPPSL